MAEARSYILRTLGCKANFADGQAIEAELQGRGWIPWSKASHAPPSLCVVNTCTVTDEADRQSRKLAGRLARENPEALVVVTGCAAEVEPERLASSAGIDYVVGNRDKNRLVELVLSRRQERQDQMKREIGPKSPGELLGGARGFEEMRSHHPMDREWPGAEGALATPIAPLEGQADRTRGFLKVQEGCNSFCTYCIIPYGRGPSRSLSQDAVVAQVRRLVESGVRELVLTGTNLGDFGADWEDEAARPKSPGEGFAELAQAILARTSLERLRLSSLDPTEITPGLLGLMEREPRLCPHLHVSLQSPHGRILRLMKRRYGYGEVERCLEAISRVGQARDIPGGVFVGMDLITGFPGETNEDFEWGIEKLTQLPWHRLHVFPYSERNGTPATRLPGSVPQAERVRRARALNRLSSDRLAGHYKKILDEGAPPLGPILFERAGKGPEGKRWVGGYTPNYLRVLLPEEEVPDPISLRNQLVYVAPVDVLQESSSQDWSFIVKLL